MDCAWTITKVVEEKNLWLRFTEFDLEDSINCTADYVVIRDGKDNNAPLIGNYIKNNDTNKNNNRKNLPFQNLSEILEWAVIHTCSSSSDLSSNSCAKKKKKMSMSFVYPRRTKEFARTRSEMSVNSRIEWEFGNVGF